MLSRQIIMTVVAAAALALAFAACAAQAQSPLAAQDHHKRGLALGQSGELDLAIAEFDRAIELSPRLADAWCNRGIAYISKLSQVAAIDPATGRTRWVYDPESWRNEPPPNLGFIHRGVTYWTLAKTGG